MFPGMRLIRDLVVPRQITNLGSAMKNSFTTYALRSEGNAGCRFSSIKAAPSPRGGFSPPNPDPLQLTGGFFSPTPETVFPLSPVLRLSGDPGNFALPELERVEYCGVCRSDKLSEVWPQ